MTLLLFLRVPLVERGEVERPSASRAEARVRSVHRPTPSTLPWRMCRGQCVALGAGLNPVLQVQRRGDVLVREMDVGLGATGTRDPSGGRGQDGGRDARVLREFGDPGVAKRVGVGRLVELGPPGRVYGDV